MKKKPQPGGKLPEHELLISSEITTFFRMDYRTLLRWIGAGLLVPIKRSRILYFRRKDVLRFINGGKDEEEKKDDEE